MNTLEQIQAAGADGRLLPSTVENLALWFAAGLPAWATASAGELVAAGAWAELNDRFYRHLEFGTGGMRGRTIGAIVTAAEQGDGSGALGVPVHAAAGLNVLNDFTLLRATLGLHRYTRAYLDAAGRAEPARLVIAHDVRHFSRHFCELAASAWTRLGGVAHIFDGPRSTPQLSFSVRWLKAHAGIVITASHNPPHDNGFKAYFEDGGQVVPPHDTGIVAAVNAVPLAGLAAFLETDLTGVVTLGRPADDAYLNVAAQAALTPAVFKQTRLKVVFTNIHGTGGVASVPLLLHAGCELHQVREQVAFDGRFPTVKSPNPENAEALALAVALAEKDGCDVVLATDPDGDRMGVAVRNRSGRMELLTGNQTGALLIQHRLTKLKELGWIPADGAQALPAAGSPQLQTGAAGQGGEALPGVGGAADWGQSALPGVGGRLGEPSLPAAGSPQLQTTISDGANRVAVIKTFVTTPLQDAIARAHGVKVINTLTGFKWIAARIHAYEKKLRATLGAGFDYDATLPAARAALLREHSTFFAFGCEESYGYLPSDAVRDKDANAACLMFAEFCAGVKAGGRTVPEHLDDLYIRHGYFLEGVLNLYYEGATGAARIKRILDTYRSAPPQEFGGIAVTQFQDFGRQVILDADGEAVPKSDFYVVTLANGWSFAARGSGTEPKMKFYVFAQAPVADAAALPAVKTRVKAELERIKGLIDADARARAA